MPTTTRLIEIATELGVTPEEIETLWSSKVCYRCSHRVLFHEEEYGYCQVEGCCCEV